MKDSTLQPTAAMPNAGNTVATALITFPQQAKRPYPTDFRVRLFNNQAVGANSKNITYSLYGTNGTNEANGGNAVLVDSWVVAGNAANHPASSRELVLPPNLDKASIYATATGEANGGDASASTFGVEIIV